jgi:hypothetical protein
MTAFPETSPTDPAPATRLRQRRHRRCTALALAVAAGLAGPASATLVSFDTTTLVGTAARLDFSLLDGDFDLGNNTFTIASITTDGTLGSVDCTLGCSGGPPYTITEAFGLGQFLQDLTLGTWLAFDVSFTTNFSGNNAPDRTSLVLLDPGTNFTLVDTDLDFLNDPVPVQDALLVVDHAPGAPIQLPTASNPNIPATIPEPGAAGLLWLGLAVLTGQRIRRRRLCQ